jgi:hypothetical protein
VHTHCHRLWHARLQRSSFLQSTNSRSTTRTSRPPRPKSSWRRSGSRLECKNSNDNGVPLVTLENVRRLSLAVPLEGHWTSRSDASCHGRAWFSNTTMPVSTRCLHSAEQYNVAPESTSRTDSNSPPLSSALGAVHAPLSLLLLLLLPRTHARTQVRIQKSQRHSIKISGKRVSVSSRPLRSGGE